MMKKPATGRAVAMLASTAAPPTISANSVKPVRLLSKPEVCDRAGKSFPTLWKWMRAGKFPRARDLGGQPAWVESEIDEFLSGLPVRQYKADNNDTGVA
jgi:predicted DNA-binding transcriptional regulator AlpA